MCVCVCVCVCVWRYATYKLNVVFVSDFAGKYIISVQAIETGKNANPCICFLACFTTKMYVYCAYPAMSKSPSQLPNYNEQSRNKRRSYSFQEWQYVKMELVEQISGINDQL